MPQAATKKKMQIESSQGQQLGCHNQMELSGKGSADGFKRNETL